MVAIIMRLQDGPTGRITDLTVALTIVDRFPAGRASADGVGIAVLERTMDLVAILAWLDGRRILP